MLIGEPFPFCSPATLAQNAHPTPLSLRPSSPCSRCAWQLGTYDPLPYVLDQTKEVRLKVDRIKYWLSVGAQPSERVSYLLWRSGVIPAPPLRFAPSKAISKEQAKAAAGEKLQ
jgi:ribosomal protein S16